MRQRLLTSFDALGTRCRRNNRNTHGPWKGWKWQYTVHWIKLFWIDILFYKNKTGQGILMIFCPLNFITFLMGKNVFMFITQGGLVLRRIPTWWRNHKGMQNHGISKKKPIAVVLRLSWRVCGCFENTAGKQKKNLRTVYNLFGPWNTALWSDFRCL